MAHAHFPPGEQTDFTPIPQIQAGPQTFIQSYGQLIPNPQYPSASSCVSLDHIYGKDMNIISSYGI